MSAAVAFACAAVSSLCWAGLDATRKQLAPRVGAVVLVTALSLGQLPIYLVWWLVSRGGIEDPAYLLPAGIEIALNVLANLLFVRAVEVSPLSLTIPFLSFTPVFATAIAIPTLGELPTEVQLIGIAAVVLGALVLTGGHAASLGLHPLAFVGALTRERGAAYMVVVAFAWACTIAIDKLAMRHAALVVHGGVQNVGVGLVLLTYLVARGRASELAALRRLPAPVLATIAFAAGGFALQLVAIQTLLVGVVETLKRAVGLVSAIAVGRVFFGEPVTATKIVAVLVMIGGTTALMLG